MGGAPCRLDTRRTELWFALLQQAERVKRFEFGYAVIPLAKRDGGKQRSGHLGLALIANRNDTGLSTVSTSNPAWFRRFVIPLSVYKVIFTPCERW